MDIYNHLFKQHEKIRQQFRHDIMMTKLKQTEDRQYRNMFIKIVLIITIFVLSFYIIAR